MSPLSVPASSGRLPSVCVVYSECVNIRAPPCASVPRSTSEKNVAVANVKDDIYLRSHTLSWRIIFCLQNMTLKEKKTREENESGK